MIERDIDGLMERTAGRPLPTGSVSPMEALLFGGLAVRWSRRSIYSRWLTGLTAALGLVVIVGYVLALHAAKDANVRLDGDRSDTRSFAASDGLDGGGE